MSCSQPVVSFVVAAVLLVASTAGAGEEVVSHEVVTYDVVTYEDHEEASAAAMAADFLIARPLGLVATTLGGVFYLAALPFAAMAGDVETPARRLIEDPARYTFQRPLGHIYGPSTPTSIHD